jgi:hypothetical protein
MCLFVFYGLCNDAVSSCLYKSLSPMLTSYRFSNVEALFMCLYVPQLRLFNQVAGFHETCYECYEKAHAALKMSE